VDHLAVADLGVDQRHVDAGMSDMWVKRDLSLRGESRSRRRPALHIPQGVFHALEPTFQPHPSGQGTRQRPVTLTRSDRSSMATLLSRQRAGNRKALAKGLDHADSLVRRVAPAN